MGRMSDGPAASPPLEQGDAPRYPSRSRTTLPHAGMPALASTMNNGPEGPLQTPMHEAPAEEDEPNQAARRCSILALVAGISAGRW